MRATLLIATALLTAALSACAPASRPPVRGDEDRAAKVKPAFIKPPRAPGVYHDIVIRPDGTPSVVITVIRPKPLPAPKVKHSHMGKTE